MPVEYLDECTLEALSKEDLVILWKKSELELQTKLNDVMNRNKRLAMAIDYLTKQEFNDVSEEVWRNFALVSEVQRQSPCFCCLRDKVRDR